MASINNTTIKSLLKREPGAIIRDSHLAGFQALRIVTGISYRYEYRVGSGRSSRVRRVTLGRHGELTPEEARQRAKKHALVKLNGRDPAGMRADLRAMPTLEEFAEGYLAAKENVAIKQPLHAKPKLSTISTYRSLIRNHIGPALGKCKLDQMETWDVERFHLKLGETNPVVSNRCLQLISSLWGGAARAKYVTRAANPVTGIERFAEFGCERFLNTDEMVRLGDAIRTAETVGIPYAPPPAKPGKKAKHIGKIRPPYVISRNAADAIRCIALMGTRMSENLEVEWCDVDLELRFMTRHTKTGKRAILIPEAAVEILKALPRVGKYVFPQDSDPTRAKKDVRKQWYAVRKLAGLEDVRLHDLRHSFASVAVSGGESLFIVGKLLGHTQSKTTERYAHLEQGPARAAVERSAGRIHAAIGGRDASASPEDQP
ncbi:tyrosine-type recombinase/integrase [Rhizobium sp. R693]|uniref:tyrosine-type recombinase/integrase n=1 Tax=Rhizobium sp. R693 TaxID=1764276 RepID=UPI000B5349C3|nr:tyrosine-type recombinase/integrase [Rhizobium sp. R693]OWV82710.1 hypothetical protein ATY79_15045 [Rhizobium sp. R693]